MAARAPRVFAVPLAGNRILLASRYVAFSPSHPFFQAAQGELISVGMPLDSTDEDNRVRQQMFVALQAPEFGGWCPLFSTTLLSSDEINASAAHLRQLGILRPWV